MIRRTARTTFVLLTLCSVIAKGQDSQGSDYQLKELRDYVDGLQSFPADMKRGKRIYDQLVKYSKMQYVVIPAQTFQWGQAHAGGVILLDISTLHKPDDILAYKFAHEWGHEALGHQPNFYRPLGQGWRFFKTPTQDEDEADEYAGKFLAANGYSIETVSTYLKGLPQAPGDFAHSTGAKRAQIVKAAFVAFADNAEPDCDTGQSCEKAILSCKEAGCPCSGLIGGPFLACREKCNSCLADAAATCKESNKQAAGAETNDEMEERAEDESESPAPDPDAVQEELNAARKPAPADAELKRLYEELKDIIDAAVANDFEGYKGTLKGKSGERWTGNRVPGKFASCEVRESEAWHQYVCDRAANEDALAVFSEVRSTLRRLVPAAWARNQSARTFIIERTEEHGPVLVLTHFADNRVRLTVTGLY